MTAGQQFLTETRERFLKAVIAQLPATRIRELYLFQPIRQGGVESGVAVVAAYQEEVGDSGAVGDGEATAAAGEAAGDGQATAAAGELAGDGQGPAADSDTPAAVELEEVTGEGAEALSCDVPAPDAEVDTADSLSPGEAPAAGHESPNADDRYTVYTARYRHTLKGPDRGRWDASIVAEADAPLLSIETVVRGVQRRAGDIDPPDHMTGDELRAALRLAPEPGRA